MTALMAPWRNWYFGPGSWHWAECTTCGEVITRWDRDDSPPRKHRNLIDDHVASHGGDGS